MVVVVIPALPIEEHGHYAIIFYLFTYISFLNKSLILQPMIRFGAVPERFKDVVNAGFYLSLLFYIAGALLVWATAPITSAILRVSVEEIHLVPLLMAAIFLREYGFCVQQTLYRTRRIFVIEAIYFLGSAGGFIYLAACGDLTTAEAVIYVNLMAAAASSVVAVLFGFNKACLWTKINLRETVELLKYGVLTLWIGIAGSITSGADILLLGVFFTPVEVAIYNGARVVYKFASAFIQAAGLLIMPYASRLSSQGRNGDLKSLYEKTIGYITVSLAVMTLIGWLVAGKMYGLLLGGAYSASVPIFCLLIIAAPFEGLYTVTGYVLYGSGAARTVAFISGVGVIIWLACAIPGIYITHSIQGGTAGLVIAMIALGLWSFHVGSKRFKTGYHQVGQRLMRNIRTVVMRNN